MQQFEHGEVAPHVVPNSGFYKAHGRQASAKISHETISDYRRIPLLAFLSRKATSKAGNCPPLR
jgi:hypothetical protein